jgi:hypothetical protein
LKARLIKRFTPDGYDWSGLVIGRRHKHRWTCIGACVECYMRMGLKLRKYGVGLLGLGSGLLDPILPIRLCTDTALRLLTLQDKADSEAASGT